MRELQVLACVVTLGLLTACAGYQTDVSEPTVSYNYADDDDYDEVAEKAEDYCDDHYDKDAYLVDEDGDDGDYEATFACR